MKLGAEPKKVVALIAIVVSGLAYYVYSNMTGDSPSTPTPRSVVANPIPAVSPAPVPASATRGRGAAQSANGGEFRVRVIGSRPDDKPDPASIDPQLRLDLLAKVQDVAPIEAGRNLFQFGTAPPPPQVLAPIPSNVPKIPVSQKPVTPPPTVVASDQKPPPPAAPPINFKYYGFKMSKADPNSKVAFLLDGDDIILAQENQTVKQHYKIVRISRSAITIEDTQANSTQTLNLQDLPTS